MTKQTLQQQYVFAIIATGRGIVVEGRTHKYVTLRRPDGMLWYVGKNGAIRLGKTVGDSTPISDCHRKVILSDAEKKIVRLPEYWITVQKLQRDLSRIT